MIIREMLFSLTFCETAKQAIEVRALLLINEYIADKSSPALVRRLTVRLTECKYSPLTVVTESSRGPTMSGWVRHTIGPKRCG